MALSNLRREPRRELTETAVGLVAVGGFFYMQYVLATWLITVMNSPPPIVVAMGLTTLLTVASLLLGLCAIIAIHSIGESICNALQRRGVHLRPRDRPQSW